MSPVRDRATPAVIAPERFAVEALADDEIAIYDRLTRATHCLRGAARRLFLSLQAGERGSRADQARFDESRRSAPDEPPANLEEALNALAAIDVFEP